jgi:hypothetical protein
MVKWALGSAPIERLGFHAPGRCLIFGLLVVKSGHCLDLRLRLGPACGGAAVDFR